jgi:Sulfotransferase family
MGRINRLQMSQTILQVDALPDTADQRPPSHPAHHKPLHAKAGWLGRMPHFLRSGLFRLLEKLGGTDQAKAIQHAALQNVYSRRRTLASSISVADQPYSDLGTAGTQSSAASRDDVVIITARFRSGSTLLWNLFRNIPGHTSYYEPFNERRWFDAQARGNHTDPTHRKVEDYWREYEGLTELGRFYQESWIDHDLFMDQDNWDPAMKRYVELLIDRAPGRPVLQFNRIDFRLAWFRHYFPRAKIVHLYRHPRDQWCSSLFKPADCPRDLTMKEFAAFDYYYLWAWARDLKYHFPFLDVAQIEHPYQLFYYVWKLSYLFGQCYSHHSVAFENITDNPDDCLTELLDNLQVRGVDFDALRKLIDKPSAGRWKNYATEAWFREHESRCEGVLAEFFRNSVSAQQTVGTNGYVPALS